MALKDQHILLGVTGSISAYKTCDLIQRLKEKGAEVRVALTPAACRLVQPATFAALTNAPVFQDVWSAASPMPHIEYARWADAFVIAPCTAHTLAELSLGLTGSPISLTALAYRGPMLIAPAMNSVMLASAPVQEHCQRLARQGIRILPTGSGVLACGEEGDGKLLSPEEIVSYIDLNFAFSHEVPVLAGAQVLIAGGHTEEPLDDVRFLSNRSSGKTATALARAFQLAGATVHLVFGRAEEPAPAGMQVTRVKTSEEFRQIMRAQQPHHDVVIMAAAIADFIPSRFSSGKWKDSKSLKKIELNPAANVLQELGENKIKDQILVGFALETEAPIAQAWEKLLARRCDFMVANNPLARAGIGFGEDEVEAFILPASPAPRGSEQLSLMEKNRLAADLVQAVAAKIKIRPSR